MVANKDKAQKKTYKHLKFFPIYVTVCKKIILSLPEDFEPRAFITIVKVIFYFANAGSFLIPDIALPHSRGRKKAETVETLVQSVIDEVMGPNYEPQGTATTAEETTSASTANLSQPSSLTASPWSRVSSPNSLEWDPEESEMVSEDVETENLLTEIERLTDRTLKETGDWTTAS